MRSALLLFALAACGTKTQSHTPAPVASVTATPNDTMTALTPTACNADSDCVMTDFSGCCSVCPAAPNAVPRIDLERQQKACAEVECAPQKGRVRCEPTERLDQYRALCRNHGCEAVRVSNAPSPSASNAAPPSAPSLLASTERCAKDDECVVTNFSGCCSSCAADAFATSKQALDARTRKCAYVDCASRRVPCPPAVDAAQYRATCHDGMCAGVIFDNHGLSR